MPSLVLKYLTLIFGLLTLQAEPAVAEEADVAHGAYLARIGDCTACHSAPQRPAFAGGLAITSPMGTIYSTNITPDPEDGIGRYSLKDFDRAVRKGIAKDGTHLYPAMPYASFAAASDQDIADLYAYFMKGVPPVHSVPPRTKLPFPFNQRWGLALWNTVFATHDHYKFDKDRSAEWNRGAYLVQTLGHCGACHTPRNLAYAEKGYTQASSAYLSGGIVENWLAPNIRGNAADGLGRWSEDDIASFLKTGFGGGSAAFGSMTQVVEDSAQYMSDSDLKAIAGYLKSLPAKKTTTTAVPSAAQWPGTGLFLSACASCHRASGQGQDRKYPQLAGSAVVLSADATSLIRLVLEGGRTAQTTGGTKPVVMPGFAAKLTDREIGEVLSFIRNSWGNEAPAVSTRDVAVLRRALQKKMPGAEK